MVVADPHRRMHFCPFFPGDLAFTENSYAEEIVRSWKAKGENAVRNYIAELLAGGTKEALEKAMEKLENPK